MLTCDWSILQVGDVAWAPYSSTVFAAVTIDGRAVVFDLSVNKYNPICNQVSPYLLPSLNIRFNLLFLFQKILSSAQGSLNSLSFNPGEPLLILGDSLGVVHSMKLSPNLRQPHTNIFHGLVIFFANRRRDKKTTEALKEGNTKLFRQMEFSKLDDILAQVIPRDSR